VTNPCSADIPRLHIQTSVREGITCSQRQLRTRHSSGEYHEDKKAATLRLMLMSSSPGVLDEDDYTMIIELAENQRAAIAHQSYQRLFI